LVTLLGAFGGAALGSWLKYFYDIREDKKRTRRQGLAILSRLRDILAILESHVMSGGGVPLADAERLAEFERNLVYSQSYYAVLEEYPQIESILGLIRSNDFRRASEIISGLLDEEAS
jgi:hypothetical protein